MFKMMSLMSILLAGVMLLSGCVMTVQAPGPEESVLSEITEPNVENPSISEEPLVTGTPSEVMGFSNVGFDYFETIMIESLDMFRREENYMCSPLSFKYALGLAIEGANGETKEELLNVLRYSSEDEFNKLNEHFAGVNKAIERINEYSEDKNILSICNSVWDIKAGLKKDYVNAVKEKYNADAKSVKSENIVNEVNGWVKDKTNGLIPTLLETVNPETSAILVNTLYLKTMWYKEFDEIYEGIDFKCNDGSVVNKEAIGITDDVNYYKDETCEMISIPMQGNINIAFVKGDNNNILEKLGSCKKEKVEITLPKIDLETSFDKKEFIKFLRMFEVEKAFIDGEADFSRMSEGLFISDIIQKTKLIMDENGIEAASATAILLGKNGMLLLPEKPIEFKADEPFSFYIYSTNYKNETEDKQLLFFGRYVK